jgi:hypothetical protein
MAFTAARRMIMQWQEMKRRIFNLPLMNRRDYLK